MTKRKVAKWRVVFCFLFGHSEVADGGGRRFRLFECSTCHRVTAVPTEVWRRRVAREKRRRGEPER